LVAVFLAFASGSFAADLRDIRVGLNKDYTRVVLETDAKAAYTLSQNGGAVTLQVQASARPQAVAAKGPHVAWVRVEPTGSAATVKLELRRPARVKQMVLTGPNRIVIDVYTDESAAPAPIAAAKPEPKPEPPPPVAPPSEPEPSPAPAVAEAPPTPRPDDEAALLAEADAVLGPAPVVPGDEIAANEGVASEPEDGSLDGVDAAQAEEAAAEADVAPPAPPIRNATKPSGGILSLFSNPYLLGVLALVMLGLVVILVKRRPVASAAAAESAEEEQVVLFPSSAEAEAAAALEGGESADEVAYEAGATGMSETAPPAEESASSFDFEAPSEVEPEKPDVEPARGALLSTIGAVTSTAAFEPPAPRAEGGLNLAELERRLTLLETRLEEVIDAKDRLERQVSAQTEELRVQRAAIARTQRVLRSVVRPDDEPGSEPSLKS
jgi:hypothetical protein